MTNKDALLDGIAECAGMRFVARGAPHLAAVDHTGPENRLRHGCWRQTPVPILRSPAQSASRDRVHSRLTSSVFNESNWM